VDVKEARNLLFQLSRVQRLAERNSAREKFPLDLRGQIVPPRNHGCPQALQDVLFLLDSGQRVSSSLDRGCRPHIRI